MRTLGVVTGYRGEADCLSAPGLQIRCSGADATRAREAALRLHHEGVAGLVSFGLAGGLAADLTPGDLLLPEIVVMPDGRRISTDPGWRTRLAVILKEAGLRLHSSPIAGSEHVVATRAAKASLARGGAAVDMESHAVAEVAAQAGLPFLVLRAVADGRDQVVPRAAHGAIDAQGNVRHLAVLAGLIRRPWDTVALIGLGRSSARGLASLRRVAALAPGLGFA